MYLRWSVVMTFFCIVVIPCFKREFSRCQLANSQSLRVHLHLVHVCLLRLLLPGINRSQSNSIRRLSSIWARQSNQIEHWTFLWVRFPNQSNKSNPTKLNPQRLCYFNSKTGKTRVLFFQHQFYKKKAKVRLSNYFCVSSIWFDCKTQSNSVHGLSSI